MYVLICASNISCWRVEFPTDHGHQHALSQATQHAARVLLSFCQAEATLYGHGVSERYTKKHVSHLLDALDSNQLPYKTPDPNLEK